MSSVQNIGLEVTGTMVVHGDNIINITEQKNEAILQPFRFKVKDPIKDFSGRNEFLEKLHDLVSDETGETTESRTVVVCGLGGVGKSESIRRYVLLHHKNFHNVIWLDGEDESTLNNAFNELARQLDIREKTGLRQLTETEQKVEQVYSTLCQMATLIVFDNVNSGYLPDLPSEIQPFEKFLPKSRASTKIVPVIIITSRNREWGPITTKVLPLDVFSPIESVEFIKRVLDPKNDGIDEDMASNLSELLGYLPLALQHAVAYIWQQNRSGKVAAADKFTISDYVQLFNCQNEETSMLMDGKSYNRTDYSWTVMTTWNMSLMKLFEHSYGTTAVGVIMNLSFLSPNDIPVELITATIKEKHRPFAPQALSLLEDYSMITCDGLFINIHRLVQFVVAERMKRIGFFNFAFDILVERLVEFILQLDHKDSLINSSINCVLPIESKINVNEKVSSSEFYFLVGLVRLCKLTENDNTFFRLLRKLYQVQNSGNVPDSKFAEDLVKYLKELSAIIFEFKTETNPIMVKRLEERLQNIDALESQKSRLELKTIISGELERLDQYDKALQTSTEIFMCKRSILGLHHGETLKTQYKIAQLLYKQGEYEKSLQVQKEVYYSRCHHVKTTDWLSESCRLMIDTLTAIGRLDEPFDWSSDAMVAVQNVCKGLGPVQAMNQQMGLKVLAELFLKASILIAQQNHQDALFLFQHVHICFSNTLGQSNATTLDVQYEVVCTLVRNKQQDDALHVFQKMCQFELETLDQDQKIHMDVQAARRLDKYFQLSEENGWLENITLLVEQIYERICQAGPQTNSKVVTLESIGGIFRNLKRFDEASTIYEQLHRIQSEKFGRNHEFTLMALQELGTSYDLQGQVKKAREVFTQVHKIQVETLGPIASETVKTMGIVARFFEVETNYQEALKMWQDVFQIRSKSPLSDEGQSDILSTRLRIGNCNIHLEYFLEAEVQFTEVFQQRSQHLGYEHTLTVEVIMQLVIVLFQQGKFKAAIQLLDSTYNIQCKKLGLLHQETRKTWKSWLEGVRIFKNVPMHTEYENTFRSKKEQLGENHPDTLASLGNFASFMYHFFSSADPYMSFQLLTELYDRRLKILGEADPSTVATRKVVSIASKLCNNPEAQMPLYVTCNGCRVLGITGPRFKCVFCEDFDFCELCLHLKDHSHHHFWRIWWKHSYDFQDDHLEIHSDLVTWAPGQDGLIPDGSFVGGLDLDSRDVVIARMNYEGYWILANLVEGEKYCRAWGKSEVKSSTYETLIVRNEDVKWVDCKVIEKIPEGAIIFEIMYPHSLYIGRVCEAKSDQFGKVYSERLGGAGQLTCAGGDVSSFDFEILVLKEPRPIHEETRE